eukprot:524104-Rhodomonas_salina.1
MARQREEEEQEQEQEQEKREAQEQEQEQEQEEGGREREERARQVVALSEVLMRDLLADLGQMLRESGGGHETLEEEAADTAL